MRPLTFLDLTRRLDARRQADAVDLDTLEDQIGWRIAPGLEDPDSFADLPAAALADIAAHVGADWRGLLSAGAQLAARVLGDRAKSVPATPLGKRSVGREPSCSAQLPRFAWRSRDKVGSTPSVEDRVMSIVVRFNPANLTTEKYDESFRRLEEANVEFPPDGLNSHICFGSEGNLRVSEIWDSREQLEAFGEKLMPILADTGIEFSGEPEIFEVHKTIKRQACGEFRQSFGKWPFFVEARRLAP